MADIELVVKIPEEIYKLCQEKELLSPHSYKVIIWDAVANGTPLPKGHGKLRILSENKLKEHLINSDFSCQKWISEVGLSNATVAIIEADKKEVT